MATISVVLFPSQSKASQNTFLVLHQCFSLACFISIFRVYYVICDAYFRVFEYQTINPVGNGEQRPSVVSTKGNI
ncbi:hypothetical protein HanPSC8_Chr07g0302951 [Helianthus annuus]|nr:hypothetical protein HanPSC8_Chr07g0302951 [Helianthus annuus]